MEFVENDIHRAVVRADGVLDDRLAGDGDGVGDAGDAAAGMIR
jgi:hypothetical protein